MNNYFDNLCRTLATPMSRSQALKLMFGGLVGAIAMPVAVALGQTKTTGGGSTTTTCKNSYSCPSATNADKNGCCGVGEICCASGTGKLGSCCPASSTCCNGTCCKGGSKCITNKQTNALMCCANPSPTSPTGCA